MSSQSNLPGPTTPIVQPNGMIDPTWFRFFLTLYNRTGAASGAGLGNVVGPSVSGNLNIALFDGTTGQLLRDSGEQLASLATNASLAAAVAPLATNTALASAVAPLAPLASPPLTGNATAVNMTFSGLAKTAASSTTSAGLNVPHGVAPTSPVNGDLWTTTAGLFGRINGATVAFSATSAPASFSAHNNGTAQSIPNGAFTQMALSSTDYNIGSLFASNSWTPPAGRPVMLTGVVLLANAVGANGLIALSVFKNGAEYKRGTHSWTTSNGNSAMVTCNDIPNGTDVYDLRLFQATGSAQPTNGGPSLTFFQGTTIQS